MDPTDVNIKGDGTNKVIKIWQLLSTMSDIAIS